MAGFVGWKLRRRRRGIDDDRGSTTAHPVVDARRHEKGSPDSGRPFSLDDAPTYCLQRKFGWSLRRAQRRVGGGPIVPARSWHAWMTGGGRTGAVRGSRPSTKTPLTCAYMRPSFPVVGQLRGRKSRCPFERSRTAQSRRVGAPRRQPSRGVRVHYFQLLAAQ